MDPEQIQIRPEQAVCDKDGERELRPLHDLAAYLREYAGARPAVVVVASLAAGFLLGWRIKP
jgi:hypothetical protein